MKCGEPIYLIIFIGDSCEFANCGSQPAICLTDFGPSFCTQNEIKNYCPLMCNQPICKCGFDSCLNGGFFFEAQCSCICPTQFIGTRCETPIVQTTTLAPTTTVQKCAIQLPCLNGAKLNQATCKCDCE